MHTTPECGDLARVSTVTANYKIKHPQSVIMNSRVNLLTKQYKAQMKNIHRVFWEESAIAYFRVQ